VPLRRHQHAARTRSVNTTPQVTIAAAVTARPMATIGSRGRRVRRRRAMVSGS
jgi:hypothetical protein